MPTRPFSGDPPPAASVVWLALDSYEIRPFSKILASVLGTRLAQVGRAWKSPIASEKQKELARKRARKWADMTTLRGLEWLTAHGRARRIGGGYLRIRPQVETEQDALLDACVEVEQRLRGLRAVWSVNPNFPGREYTEEVRAGWSADLDALVRQLDVVSKGIRKRRRGG